MTNLLNLASGRKSYIIAALWALATFLYTMGFIDDSLYMVLQGILAPAGIASLRAGITREAEITRK